MKPLILELPELNKYRNEQSVQYAFCGKTKKELRLTFKGEMIVLKDKKEVGIYLFQSDAIKKFNEI
jgi:hypothetical protein